MRWMPQILLILVINITNVPQRMSVWNSEEYIFQSWYFFYFEQLKLLLMSACVLVAEQRSVGAHFSQRLGCGTASMSGI